MAGRLRDLGLPTQEGIGLVVNDIPDVGRVACARVGDCDYVPRRH